MDPEAYSEMLAALAAQQATPTGKPLPRRTRIYLMDEQRPDIHGRPMEVTRASAREWVKGGLAKPEPFSEAATGHLVTPMEYRPPEKASMVPLAFNPNSGRYEPAPGAVTSGLDSDALERLVAAEVERRMAAASSSGPSEETELERLRKQWLAENEGKKYPPAAREAWFRKELGA